jgi:hypothetical protein
MILDMQSYPEYSVKKSNSLVTQLDFDTNCIIFTSSVGVKHE